MVQFKGKQERAKSGFFRRLDTIQKETGAFLAGQNEQFWYNSKGNRRSVFFIDTIIIGLGCQLFDSKNRSGEPKLPAALLLSSADVGTVEQVAVRTEILFVNE